MFENVQLLKFDDKYKSFKLVIFKKSGISYFGFLKGGLDVRRKTSKRFIALVRTHEASAATQPVEGLGTITHKSSRFCDHWKNIDKSACTG